MGTDYLTRAAVAKSNIYVNVPPEAKYFYNDNDSAGTQLDGRNLYAVTFAKGQLPPVKGFWSVTLYNDRHLFNPNPLKAYSLGTKNKTLRYNRDGSLTIYAGATSPGKEKESNWLPAPRGRFSLIPSRVLGRGSHPSRGVETTGDHFRERHREP